MSGDTNARNHRRLVDRDFHLHSLSSAIECGSGTGHPGGGGWRSEPVKPARTIRRWSGTVVVQRFRRDCDPGHRRHRNPPFCDDPHKRAGVVLTKSRRCNCSVTFCSAARISACASRRRKSTFSAARSPSRSPRPEFHQIRFLQQNLRSAVFATCPS